MKYKVLSPIRNNGKYYPVDSEISLKEVPKGIKDFLEVIQEDKPTAKKAARPPKGVAPRTKKKSISKKQ